MRRPKNIFDKLNRISQKHKSLIEVLGILTGLVLLVLTFWSTLISRDLLRLSQQQEINKQLPIWDFEVIDSASIIKLKPFTSDIKIQRANFFYPKAFIADSLWPIDPPEFNMHVGIARWEIENLCKKRINYADTNYAHISFRNQLHIGLEVNYIQYGESRTVYGLYMIQYLLNQKYFEPKIEFEGVLFEGYYSQKELFKLLDELSEEVKKEISNNDTMLKGSR